MDSYAYNELRALEHGWDIEPRGHDFEQARYLWCLGYRRNTWAVCGWRVRLLVPYGIRNRLAEKYVTHRTFEAFREIERQAMITTQVTIEGRYFTWKTEHDSAHAACVVIEKMPAQPGKRAVFKVRFDDGAHGYRQARDLRYGP